MIRAVGKQRSLSEGSFGTPITSTAAITTRIRPFFAKGNHEPMVQKNCVMSEINTLSMLQTHRNIVPLIRKYSIFNGDRSRIVMPRCETDLYDRLAHPDDIWLAGGWRKAVGDLLRAVAYVHSHQFMHGDIKPENVLFYSGNWVLCDFGNATMMNRHGIGFLGNNITKEYASPEALRCRQIAARGENRPRSDYHGNGYACDVWSVAQVLVAMHTFEMDVIESIAGETVFANPFGLVDWLNRPLEDKRKDRWFDVFCKRSGLKDVDTLLQCLSPLVDRRPTAVALCVWFDKEQS